MHDRAAELEVDHLIQPRWAGVLCVVVLASVILRQPVLFFAGAVLLLALGMSWIWGRYCLERLEYRRAFSSTTVAFGEEVTLSITVVNRKLLPLAWIEIDDEIPRSLQPARGELLPLWKPQRGILQQLLALRWYERVTRRYQLRCTERGEQVFGPVELRSGDLFGLARRRLSLPARQTLLVYPKVVPVTALGLPSRFPLGDERSRQRIFRDPLRVAGTRPYIQGDSLRQVHWKATARLGTLQVKNEEPSVTLRAMLLLNLQTTSRIWEGASADLLELLICVAASLASHLAAQRAQYGLISNALLAHTEGGVRVPVSRSPRQLTRILTVLAQITPLATTPFVDLLAAERQRVPVGSTIVLITGFLDQQILDQAHAYRSAGHPVRLLLAGEALREVATPGLTAAWIGDERRWRNLQALQVAWPPTGR
ncbi:MAG TPA: DUF58 domain-containing protein [Chloroflexota bacterium]|jgi:uncharacterized protein (DUF58 family)|nr:DUF58 domain-containing protein [Chloroflexota bacterium]